MCFSATASFSAGALLSAAGVFAMSKTKNPKVLPFASSPLLFGLQQITEGVVWITASDPELAFWKTASMYLYLIIAFVVWPIFIPIGTWMMEPIKARKKVLSYFLWVGGAAGLYFLANFIALDVTAEIQSHHILYSYPVPFQDIIGTLILGLYVTAMGMPLLISSLKGMRFLWVVMFGSMVLALIIYYQFVVSIWCFFAAILSIVVIFVIIKNKETVSKPLET